MLAWTRSSYAVALSFAAPSGSFCENVVCFVSFQWKQHSLHASTTKERWYKVSRQVAFCEKNLGCLRLHCGTSILSKKGKVFPILVTERWAWS